MVDTTNTPQMVAIDPATGLHIRLASEEERAAYLAQPTLYNLPSFRKAIRVGDVLIDEDTGPGVWFGGAGF